MNYNELRLEIVNKIDDIELELENAKKYYRSSLMGQLIAHNDFLAMINKIEKSER